jgi:hypothetical protein
MIHWCWPEWTAWVYGRPTNTKRQPAGTGRAAAAGDARGVGASEAARRATGRIFAGVIVATCGGYAAVVMAPVLGHDITGSAFLAGLPIAVLLAGAGAGATRVAAVIRRRGHQTAFTLFYLVGTAGCLLSLVAAAIASFPLLLVGVLGIGVGHAVNQLARYAAAELHPEPRRPSVIGWMVWALTIGAVVGPLSVGPAGRLAVMASLPAQAGGFLVGAALFAAAAGLHQMGPRVAAAGAPDAGTPVADGPRPWALPRVQIAIAAMVTCLVVMLLVMTVTPVHVHSAGHGLGAVGAIMSVHTLGMFGLAPVAGRLTARFGSVPVILGALAVLSLAAGTGAAAPASSQVLLSVALFALGFGWCLGFVAASALLTQGLAPHLRVQLQGRVEAVTWISGAGAAVGSGLLLGLISFPGLNLVAGGLLVVPLAVIVLHRRSTTPGEVGVA